LEIELGYVTALNKATTFWSLGQYQDAITVWQALEIEPNNVDIV
jgi:hypothetical protein